MKKYQSFLMKTTVFIIISFLLLHIFNITLSPKWTDFWNATPTTAGFYELPKNSIDILFLGSSQIKTGISPLELYENYGYASYNLGTDGQNMLTSYYWLEEALRYQTPKVVILDPLFLYVFDPEIPDNMDIGKMKKALDYMKFSPVKVKASREIVRLCPEEKLSDYLFPVFSYHDRWTELTADDFRHSYKNRNALMGYSMSSLIYPSEYQGFSISTPISSAPPNETMLLFFQKIVDLCEKKDISLVLLKTPRCSDNAWTPEQHQALSEIAAQNRLPFLDFNETSLLEAVHFNNQQDFMDSSHINRWGAEKITNYLGSLLSVSYPLTDYRGSYSASFLSDSLNSYHREKYNSDLGFDSNLHTYLEKLKGQNYCIFTAMKGPGIEQFTEPLLRDLREIGIYTDFQNSHNDSFLAVISKDEVHCEIAPEKLSYSGVLNNGIFYEISSAGKGNGNACSILLDDTEYSLQGDGLNFVIYDKKGERVIDAAYYDFSIPEQGLIHRIMQ